MLGDASLSQYSTFSKDKQGIEKNISNQAKYAKALYIWTDCDREGEHIGSEIRDVAVKAKSNLEVKRAKFSNIEKACVTIFLMQD